MAKEGFPAVWRVADDMPMISQIFFTSRFYIDQLDESELNHPAKFDGYLMWIWQSHHFFSAFTTPYHCRLQARHQIRYYLFCPLPLNTGDIAEYAIEHPTSESIFDVLPGPAENSVRLYGLNLWFGGVEKLVVITSSGTEYDEKTGNPSTVVHSDCQHYPFTIHW
jgi:hypothetical protein